MMLRTRPARPGFWPRSWPKILPKFLPEPLERAAPVLADQLGAEAVVGLLADQREAGPLVDAPRLRQHAVAPQRHLGVAGRAGEPPPPRDQLGADAAAPRGRVHVQQPQ